MLLLDERKTSALLPDEIVNGEFFTRFPGGGIEYGAGILC
jgi:hypothetical protein